MRIVGRISRLEHGTVQVAMRETCERCGRVLHGPRKGHFPEGVTPKVAVKWGTARDDTANDHCSLCGAPLVVRIEFDRSG